MTSLKERVESRDIPAEHRNANGKLDIDGLIARDGWVYRDLPGKLSHEMWDHFIGILADAPYYILIASEGPDWRRGQFLLSPQAMANIAAYSATKRAEQSSSQERTTP